MEQQQQQVSREAVADVGMESGQQHHQQEQHHQQHQHHQQQQQSEWDSFGPDSCGSATLLGPFGAMAETLNAGTAEADKAGLDAVAKPRTTESPPAPAAAAATGYMEMGQMSDFEILAHEKGDESDVSPAGVRVELEMPKNWTSDFEAQKEVFYQDPSPSIFQDLSTGHGERFATAGLSEVDLNKAAGSPHSDEGQQIESCDSSPADDIVTVFPKPSALFTESSVASFQGRGSPEAVGSLSGKTSPSEDKTPKKATSPDKPMEKLIYLAQEKYLDTTVPQKRESDGPSDGEVLTKNPRKDERAEALKPRDAHVGEKQPVVYHPGYSEAETISISQESSPLEEISPISEEFTDKLIVASDEVQMRQPSTEMEYSISLSQESSPGEDSSPVTGNLGHVFPKPSAAATTVQQQQQQLAGIDSSEEKQVPIAKKDNSLTSSYVSSSTEESSPGEEGVRVVGGGSKSGEKEDFVEEVAPLSHEEERSPRKTESRAGVDGKEPGFAVESLGASWGSEDDWPASEGVRAAEPAASSKGDLGGRVVGGNVAEEPHLGGKSPGVPPTRGAAAGGGHAEGPREEQTAADAHAGAAATACWPAGSRDAFHAVLAAPPLLEGAIAGPGVRAVASVQSDDDEPIEPEKGEGEAFDGHHAKEKFAPPKADSVTEKAPAAKSVAEEEEEEREHLEAATKAAICAAQQSAARERDLGSERVSEATGVDATDSDERNVDTEEEDEEEEEGKELWAAAAERAETRRAVEGSMQELSRALEKMKGDSRLAIEEVLQREEGEGGAAVAADARKANEVVCVEAAVPGGAGRLPAEDTRNDFPLPGNAARAVGTGAVEASSVQVPFTDIIAAASEEALTETPASARTVRSVCPVASTESHVEDKSAVGKPVTRQEETAFEKEREVNLGGSDISFENIDRAGGELKRRQHQQEETSVAVKDDASSSLTEATAQNLENCARAAAAAIIVGHEVGRGGGEGGPLECEAPAPTSDARAKGDTTSTWDRVPTETDPAGDSSAESEDGAAARDSHRQEQWRQDQRVPAGGETRGDRSGEAPQPDALRATEETAQEAPRGEPTMAREELEATAVLFQAPRELQSSLESARVAKGQGTANDFMDFEVGSAKQQPQQQPQQQPRQQEPAVAVSVAKFDTPPSAVRVIDSEEEDDDDDEYENEFYTEETVASAAAPWVQKSLITVEEEELSKPGKVTVIPEPLGGAAGPPPQAAAEPKGPVAAPAAATAGPAPAGDKEEEPKGLRPSQPPPTWPGFGPPTVIIEEAAEEGGAEREEPAPEVRPRGKPSEAAATAAAAAAAAAEEEKQPEVEKKLPAKAEDGKSRQSLLEKIHLPAVSELVYWRDPRWSGGVLGVLLLLLLSIAHLSVFTIVGYLGLLMLTCTITWRVCRGVLCAVQKREDGHPFRTYLAEDVDVTRERMSRQVEAARVWTTGAATELRRLLLVQDLVDSLKFAGVLWLMTYVGSVFNGLSLLILGVVLLFSVPIAYEKKKTEVDHYLALVQAKVDDATARVKSMIPAALRPNEANSSAK